jgi:hypothetical protein
MGIARCAVIVSSKSPIKATRIVRVDGVTGDLVLESDATLAPGAIGRQRAGEFLDILDSRE